MAWGDVIIDLKNQNNGTLNASEVCYDTVGGVGGVACPSHVLSFGVACETKICCCLGTYYKGSQSGQAIGSAVTSGAPNKNGLDFYTNYTKRISITKCGAVGIGTVTPSSTLEVNGNIALDSLLYTKCAKVGIGTCNPLNPLCVVGNANVRGGVSAKYVTADDICGTAVYGIGALGVTGIAGLTSSTLSCGPGVCGLASGIGVRGRSAIGHCLPPCCCTSYGGCGPGVCGSSVTGQGVKGSSFCGVGVAATVQGVSLPIPPGAVALLGAAGGGIGVLAYSESDIAGKFKNNATTGNRSALVQFENGDTTVVDWNAGVSGLCNACKVPDGSFYVGQKGKPSLVVNTGGHLGIGTTNPQTTLQVKGGFSLNLKTETSCYSTGTSDFGILADPSVSGKAITLPLAKFAGMVVYIKNISPSFSVTLKASGTDHIEVGGSLLSTYSLGSKYHSVTLIAGGGSPGVWYILSNAT